MMETSIEDIDKIDADINDEMSHQTLKLSVLSSEILLDSDLSPFAVSLGKQYKRLQINKKNIYLLFDWTKFNRKSLLLNSMNGSFFGVGKN